VRGLHGEFSLCSVGFSEHSVTRSRPLTARVRRRLSRRSDTFSESWIHRSLTVLRQTVCDDHGSQNSSKYLDAPIGADLMVNPPSSYALSPFPLSPLPFPPLPSPFSFPTVVFFRTSFHFLRPLPLLRSPLPRSNGLASLGERFSSPSGVCGRALAASALSVNLESRKHIWGY